jgi:hypothetical protein
VCEALVAGRPMVAYDYAQAWISHGGARTIGPWLGSVAHMLQVDSRAMPCTRLTSR